MPVKVSTKAVGALWAMIHGHVPPSAENLSKVLPECEKTLRKLLRELEDAGFINRGKYAIRGKVYSYTEVTEEGYQYLLGNFYPVEITGLLPRAQQYKQNKPIPSTTELLTKSTGDAREEKVTIEIEVENMPYDFFTSTSSDDGEAALAKARWQRQKQAENQKAKQDAQANKIFIRRETIPKTTWSVSDSGFEFASRLESFWSIPPWSLTKSRFIPALATMRSRLETNGELECLMFDLFFESIQHDKYDSADALWKLFITRAPELVVQARSMSSSGQDLVDAKVQADKSWDWIDGDDQ